MSAARKTRGDGVGDRLLRAISHPIRIEVLRVLDNRVASPKELAGESGESLGDISYHVKYLRRQGCIEILDTATRGSAIEHYYRAKTPAVGDGKSWADLSEKTRAEISAQAIRSFLGEAVRALNAGSFDARRDRHLSWTTMDLDEQGWRELIEGQARWLEELNRVKAEAAERLADSGESGKPVVAGMLGFETPPER